MKKVIAFVIIGLFLCTTVPHAAYAGWKETYRTKYSKKELDPNSEKAKKIRRLANPDIKFLKWKRTPEEREASGLPEPKRSLSANIMPSKRKGQSKDQFEGFNSNYYAARKDLPKEEEEAKTGYTLEDCIKKFGKVMGDTMCEETRKVKDRIVKDKEEGQPISK